MSNSNYAGNITNEKLEDILKRNSNIMSSTYPDLTKYSVWYKEGFSNDTTNSMNEIINSINENLAQLDFVQTNFNSSNNLNQEALIKQGELLKLKNEDLKKQLQNLEIIQSNINNKERLIDQTQLNTINNDVQIYLLVVAIILAIIIVVFIILYGSGKINVKILSLILIIIGFIYFLMYIYTYNIFSYRDALSYLSSVHSNWYLGKELKEWANPIITEFNESIQESKDKWIANNCDCPVVEEQEENQSEEGNKYNLDGIELLPNPEKEVPGYYYKDHSAPAQLIVPLPSKVKDLNQSIDWVDYSSNGNVKYNSDTNENIYINKNYYNYKPAQTQSQELLFELNNNGSLVKNSTKTGNM